MPSIDHLAGQASADAAFMFVGDHPSLDLLNTVVGKGDGRLDLLKDVASLRLWVTQVPSDWPEETLRLLELSPGKAWDAALAQVREVRELAREVVTAWRAGMVPPPLMDELRRWMQQVPYSRDLRQADGALVQCWVARLEGPRALAGLLAVSFADLLAGASPTSVKSCAGAGCSLQFLDRTKGQRRVFCSAAQCGNRAKVAAFRARKRALEAGHED